MNVLEVNQFIDKNKSRHLSNKVLHAHPSPMLWKNDFDRDMAQKALSVKNNHLTKVNMYIGIPFCLPTDPPHCGFCLFPTEKYAGKESSDNYLDHLEMEAELYRDFYNNACLESLYVGGGTPNLLQPRHYERLMAIVDHLFPDSPCNIEKTIEGIPQLFDQEKVAAIHSAGFNRVSMGVQQVTDKLIVHSGRKQTQTQVFDSIKWFNQYQLACNVDLIYGWPDQTLQDMEDDIRAIADSGVNHITHYELNIAGRSNFSTKMKKRVCSIESKIEMYIRSKEIFNSLGFKQRTVYDWERDDNFNNVPSEYSYEDNLRHFLPTSRIDQSSCMGGLGYASINMRMHSKSIKSPSVSAINHQKLSLYYSDVEQSNLPIERLYLHNDDDIKLVWLFQSLQEMKIDLSQYSYCFQSSLIDEFRNIWSVLSSKEWVEVNTHEIVLTDIGEFYVPLIQSLLSKDRVDELLSPVEGCV